MTAPILIMPESDPAIDESDFIHFIESGARRLTPRQVQQLVSDLPDLTPEFTKMRDSAYPGTERQLHLLALLVEAVWTDRYRDMSYGAALEAAFALSYFHRAEDLIPDSIEGIGLIDDAAIVATIFARNTPEFEAFARETRTEWPGLELN